MRHDFIDRYSRIDSPVHRLPAALKFAVSLCIIVTVISTPFGFYPVFPAILFSLTAAIIVGKIPIVFVVKRLFFLEMFVVGVALLSLLQSGGTTRFLTIIIRSTLCILTVIVLSNTTQFSDLLGLLRRLRIPAIFITVLALLYRYLFVLIDEAERMSRGRTSRTFVHGKTSRWREGALLIGELFIRSTERAGRIYAAMTARGWK